MTAANTLFVEALERINEIKGASYVMSDDGLSAVVNDSLVLEFHCDSWTIAGDVYEIPGFYPIIDGERRSIKPVKLGLLHAWVTTWMGEQTFSPRELVARRTALGLSQSELAQILGVSQAALALWESGKRQPSHAASVLDELDRLEGRAEFYVTQTVNNATLRGYALVTAAHEMQASYPAGFCDVVLARAAQLLREAGHTPRIH